MKKKKYVAVLLALVVLVALCSCSSNAPGEAAEHAMPTQDVQEADAKAKASTSDITKEPADAQTVLGYVAEEIPTPEWIEEFGSCDIYNEAFYLLANTTDGGTALVCFDTQTEQFARFDIDVASLHSPLISNISVADNSAWIYVAENYTAQELAQGLFTGETNIYIMHLDLSTGEQTLSPIYFWEDGVNPPLFLIALDNERALIGNDWSQTPTYLINKAATVIDTPDLIVQGSGVRAWVDNALYVQTADGLAALSRDTLEFGEPIEEIYDQPAVYSSSRGAFSDNHRQHVFLS